MIIVQALFWQSLTNSKHKQLLVVLASLRIRILLQTRARIVWFLCTQS